MTKVDEALLAEKYVAQMKKKLSSVPRSKRPNGKPHKISKSNK